MAGDGWYLFYFAPYKICRMEESGTRDINGNWIPETPQAKLRNRLSPFWTLTDIMSSADKFEKILQSDNGLELIQSLVQRCQENKEVILNLIKETE
jgi:hypothetical protein